MPLGVACYGGTIVSYRRVYSWSGFVMLQSMQRTRRTLRAWAHFDNAQINHFCPCSVRCSRPATSIASPKADSYTSLNSGSVFRCAKQVPRSRQCLFLGFCMLLILMYKVGTVSRHILGDQSPGRGCTRRYTRLAVNHPVPTTIANMETA